MEMGGVRETLQEHCLPWHAPYNLETVVINEIVVMNETF